MSRQIVFEARVTARRTLSNLAGKTLSITPSRPFRLDLAELLIRLALRMVPERNVPSLRTSRTLPVHFQLWNLGRRRIVNGEMSISAETAYRLLSTLIRRQ